MARFVYLTSLTGDAVYVNIDTVTMFRDVPARPHARPPQPAHTRLWFIGEEEPYNVLQVDPEVLITAAANDDEEV